VLRRAGRAVDRGTTAITPDRRKPNTGWDRENTGTKVAIDHRRHPVHNAALTSQLNSSYHRMSRYCRRL